MKVKIFDKEVKWCNECHFLHKDDYNFKLSCSKTKKQLNYEFSIHSDCPFKSENSFTDEHFKEIGFEYWNKVTYKNKKGVCVTKSHLDSGWVVEYVNELGTWNKVRIEVTSFPHLKFILESLI